jgi:hypothetical protein
MIRNTFFIALLVACLSSGAQTVVISGAEGNRPLTWSDFTGSPDASSIYFANTGWNIGYTMPPIRVTSDSVSLKGFVVKLELNPVKSWVKKGRESADLLKHEQGHYDITALAAAEFYREILNLQVGDQATLKGRITEINDKLQAKIETTNIRYDLQTDHSRNAQAQQKWDQKIAAEKQKKDCSLDYLPQ